jgi:hypothetical protein
LSPVRNLRGAGRKPGCVWPGCVWLAFALAAAAATDARAQAVGQPAAPAAGTTARGCLASGNGYLRARIRGALNLDINWRNAELECAGDERADGSALRVMFAGPQRPDGHRLRMVFGIAGAREGKNGHEFPTNLTVILEGDGRLFATRGDEHCTVDRLRQERLETGGGASAGRSYRIVVRGFCISPASTLNNAQRILVSSFDFAGRATFGEAPPALGPVPGNRV